VKAATRSPIHGIREPTVFAAGTATFARLEANPVIAVSVNHTRQSSANLIEKTGGVDGVDSVALNATRRFVASRFRETN
jgi:hypothetical protein